MPSPFVPSHKRQFTAKKVFTDREEPVTFLLRAFDPPSAADAHRAPVFYGVGGEGKTDLTHHLLGLLETEYTGRAGWAAVNFKDSAMRRPAGALLSIRRQLRETRAGLANPPGLPNPEASSRIPPFAPPSPVRQDRSWRRHPPAAPGAVPRPPRGLPDALDLFPDLGEILSEALDEVSGLDVVYRIYRAPVGPRHRLVQAPSLHRSAARD